MFQNVSHKTLCYLLEYVYTGEVLIPASQFPAFLRTAKELHIRGLENVVCIITISLFCTNTSSFGAFSGLMCYYYSGHYYLLSVM